jgi:hypothetical protein
MKTGRKRNEKQKKERGRKYRRINKWGRKEKMKVKETK